MNDHTPTSELPPVATVRLRPRPDPVPRTRDRRPRHAQLLLLLIVLVAAIGAVTFWYLTKDTASTDDAYTDGHAITVAPQVSGIVVALWVTDNQRVKAGDVLIEIDPRSYAAARDQAKSSLDVAEAQLADARINLDWARQDYPARLAAAKALLSAAEATHFKAQADQRRQRGLPRQATSQQDIDTADAALRTSEARIAEAQAAVQRAELVPEYVGQAEAHVHQLEAQVALARAQLQQAELNLSWTKVVAPQDGWITKRNVEQGNYVQAGQAVLSIVTPDIWITANFKESQLGRMRPGQKVDIAVDAYPNLKLTGHVDSIQLGSGSRFTAFPPENATGNFVKIVQRVPVKIAIDSGLDPAFPLPLGLSVEPTVHLAPDGRGS
jgi:membrane fusion protein (multidrug efflux system)